MSTQPTNNPVPSESPRDLKFNAGKIDEFVTSLAMRYTDRFGYQHYTIEGLRQLAYDAISGFGWVLRESFEDGATLTLPNEALLWESNGEYYRWSGALDKTVPAGSTPESTGGVGQGAWVGIGDAALKTMLASSAGASMIGMAAGGTLQQIIHYVTPEQFGAIGDGTVHPLSERYTTLAAAKEVYPHVTALTQTIDWAACQAADNYSRGKVAVRCPYAVYHFGSSNYLALGVNSKWYGVENTPLSTQFGTTMIRTKPSVKPSFGQDATVRVMNAADAGSPDEFVRGIEFIGIHCSRGVSRRSASKYDSSFAFHANMAMKAKVGISVSGAEYGAYGYVCWGMTGYIKYDSCHKGVWFDPETTTPEYTPLAGSALTSMDLRIEGDATPYGITVRRCKYSKIAGFTEGILANSTYTNYDYANETAIAITCYNCDSVDFTEFGIEAWQGVHIYNYGGTVTANLSWTQDYKLLNTTGKHGPYHAMSVLMSNTELFTLPATANSQFYNLNVGSLTVRNLTGDWSDTTIFGTTYFITLDQTSRTVFENCGVYFGANAARIAPNWLGNIETVGGRYIVDAITPSGYTKIGPNFFIKTTWGTKVVNGGDGRVAITVGTDTPTNLKIHDVDAKIISSGQTNPLGVGIVSATDSAIAFQTPVTTAATFSINWKAYVSWNG